MEEDRNSKSNPSYVNRPQAHSTLSSREDFLKEREDAGPEQKEIFSSRQPGQEEDAYDQLDLDKLPKGAYGGFWIRTAAYLIDLFLVSLLTTLIFNLSVYRLFGRGIEDWWLFGLLELFILLVYFTATNYAFQGQSLGKMLLGLRTLRSDGRRLDRTTVLVRETAGRAIIKIIPVLAVFLIFDTRRRHLIDMLCGTVVVNENQLAMLADYTARE